MCVTIREACKRISPIQYALTVRCYGYARMVQSYCQYLLLINRRLGYRCGNDRHTRENRSRGGHVRITGGNDKMEYLGNPTEIFRIPLSLLYLFSGEDAVDFWRIYKELILT
ncbi:hypothetical protein Trydic_g15847 [Trypoxylus dichotomus]